MSETETAAQAQPAAAPDTHLVWSVLVALVFGAGLVFAARDSALALLIAIAVTQAAVTFAFVLGTDMPGRKGGILIAAMAAAAADTCVSVWPHGRLGTLVAVLGLAIPVLFVHQLARGAARVHVVSSLAGVATLVLTVVALAAYVQIRHEFGIPYNGGKVAGAAIAAVAVGVVAAGFLDMVAPVPRFDPDVSRGLLAVVAAAIVGGCVGYLLLHHQTGFDTGRATFAGAALGAIAGLLALGAGFVLVTTPEPVTRWRRGLRPVVGGLLPIALLAPGAFLVLLAIRR